MVFINLAHGLQKNNYKNRKFSCDIGFDIFYNNFPFRDTRLFNTRGFILVKSGVFGNINVKDFSHDTFIEPQTGFSPLLESRWCIKTSQIKITALEKHDSSRGIRTRDYLNQLLTSSVSVISYFPEGKNDVCWVIIGKHAICILITLQMVLIQE